MDLDQAIQRHSEWRTKFRSAISKKESMDESTISKDDCCELGKWLHNDAKVKLSRLGSYQECITKHARFHQEAGKVAKLINAKKYTEAEAAIGAGSSYSIASTEVGAAIIKLKKEAAN
jgi:Chemoreceptor zinc-binding domain